MKVGTYLTFDGNCAEAFDYYKGIFGGEYTWKATFGESPLKDKTPEEWHGRIMHVSLNIGSQKFALMGCDRNPEMHKKDHTVGTNTQISLTPESKVEADRLYQALSDGGLTDNPMKDQFWGSYFGSCTDKYGVQWMIDCATKSNQGESETLKDAANALREVADVANQHAAKLEMMASEPHSKKVKTSHNFEKA